VLPHRSKIYHPSTAPFVNSDVFMKQPYYIIHASLGFKDQSQFSYYLTGHAEDQQEHKQKGSVASSKGKIPRTFSHNSHMNVGSSVPFYPGKGKVISKPMMHQIQSYKDIRSRFPTSASHGMLVGMGENPHNVYSQPPGLENSIPSQNNIYRPHREDMSENWNRNMYPQDGNYANQKYMQWQNSGSQMIPSALQAQVPMKKKAGNMKGSVSTEFNYNFGEKLTNDNEEKVPFGLFENKSDSDEENHNHKFYEKISESMGGLRHPNQLKNQAFSTGIEPIRKYTGQSLGNVKESEEAKE